VRRRRGGETRIATRRFLGASKPRERLCTATSRGPASAWRRPRTLGRCNCCNGATAVAFSTPVPSRSPGTAGGAPARTQRAAGSASAALQSWRADALDAGGDGRVAGSNYFLGKKGNENKSLCSFLQFRFPTSSTCRYPNASLNKAERFPSAKLLRLELNTTQSMKRTPEHTVRRGGCFRERGQRLAVLGCCSPALSASGWGPSILAQGLPGRWGMESGRAAPPAARGRGGWGRAGSSRRCLEGLRESWRGAWGGGTRGDGLKLKAGRFPSDIGTEFFMMGW